MKMRIKLDIEGLKAQFADKPIIQVSDIYSYYNKREPEIKQTTIYLRINTLVNDGVLQRIGRANTIWVKKVFIPEVSRKMKEKLKRLSVVSFYLPNIVNGICRV
jgi:hypothetical protein